MKKKAIILLFGLGGSVGGLLLFCGPLSPGEEPSSSSKTVRKGNYRMECSGSSAIAINNKGERDKSREKAGAGLDLGGEDERKKLASPSPTSPLKVKVQVRGENGILPVSGAKVFLFDKTGLNGKRWEKRDRVFAEAPGFEYAPGLLSRDSRIFVTNASGIAYVPVKWGGPLVAKDDSGLIWAESTDGLLRSPVFQIGRDENGVLWKRMPDPREQVKGEIRLLLTPISVVKVIVKGPEGKSVPGVPLGLFYSVSNLKGGRFLVLKTRTNSKGVGLFSGVGKIIESLKPLNCFFVSFLFPVRDLARNSVRLKEENLRGEPIWLDLPPTGSVEVRVTGLENTGKKHKEWISLLDAARKYKDGWGGWDWYWAREKILNYSVPINGGKSLFPLVGLGMKLVILCVRTGILRVSRKEIVGPTVPGQKVFSTISIPREDPFLAMVLVDQKRNPLPNLPVSITYPRSPRTDLKVSTKGGYLWGVVSSKEDGSLRFPLPPSFTCGRIKQVGLVSRGKSGRGKLRICVLDLPPPFSRGCKELGEVVLSCPPLLVSGVVLGFRGKPVSGATVTLSRPALFGKKEGWMGVTFCKSGQDGSFFLGGSWPWKRMAVEAYKPSEGGSEPLVLPPGSKGLKLTLTGTGSLRGRVLLDRAEYLKRLYIEVCLKKLGRRIPGSFWGIKKKVGVDGSFLYKGLPPGSYTFFLRANGEPESKYCVIEGVMVKPNRTNIDPRLQGVDARGLFDEARLEVTGEQGNVLKNAYIKGLNVHTHPPEKSFLLVFGKGHPPTCLVKAKGYQGVTVRVVPGKRIIIQLKKEKRKRGTGGLRVKKDSKGKRSKTGGGMGFQGG